LRINTNQRLGRVYYDMADYQQAIELLWENVALLQGDRIGERFGNPNFPAVLSRAWLVLCLAEHGKFVQGSTQGEEGIRLAEALADPYSQIHAYAAMGGLYLCKGDLPQAIDALKRSLGLYQTWNFPLVFPSIASQLGYAY